MKTSIKLLASALLLTLTVSSAALADDHSQKKVFASAIFPAADESKLWVCLEKYQSENKVSLELVNERGDVLVQEVLLGKHSKRNSCRQQFDMSQLPDGNYTFRIMAGTQKEEVTFHLATRSTEAPTRLVAIN